LPPDRGDARRIPDEQDLEEVAAVIADVIASRRPGSNSTPFSAMKVT